MNKMNRVYGDAFNLVPAIWAIGDQITKIEARHRQELRPYKNSLAELQKINEVCERCGGAKVISRYDAAGDTEEIRCPDCKGSGLIGRKGK